MEYCGPFGHQSVPITAIGLSGIDFQTIETVEIVPTIGGIMAFDLLTGRRIVNEQVDFAPVWKHIGGDGKQELEGIAVFNLGGTGGALSGQVHLQIIYASWDTWFRHWTTDPDKM